MASGADFVLSGESSQTDADSGGGSFGVDAQSHQNMGWFRRAGGASRPSGDGNCPGYGLYQKFAGYARETQTQVAGNPLLSVSEYPLVGEIGNQLLQQLLSQLGDAFGVVFQLLAGYGAGFAHSDGQRRRDGSRANAALL